ncbi:MAG: S8 family serine peptidase [Bacteroidia bacterium]
MIHGKGIRIAVLDAGFKDADKHPALDHIRKAKRIIATRDFYDGDENVYHHSLHGMQVMSCIGGKYQGRDLGCAPEAGVLLASEREGSEKALRKTIGLQQQNGPIRWERI